jgi:hypothetical protein
MEALSTPTVDLLASVEVFDLLMSSQEPYNPKYVSDVSVTAAAAAAALLLSYLTTALITHTIIAPKIPHYSN